MNAARSGHSETLLPNGTVLVTGGSFQLPAELFDPVTNTFAVLPAGAVSDRVYGSATAMADGRVFLAGGIDGSGILNTAEIFDPANLSSTPIAATMVSPRYGHTATLLPTGKVLICGGEDYGGVSNTGELFDPAGETFTPVASSMSVPRYVQTATHLSDGRILIAGGFTGPGAAENSDTNTADIFDPATESFVPVASPMNSARYGHTATLLPDGKVLLIGGWNGTAPVASAEIFDSTTLTFSALANAMTSPREVHTATLLMNGKVLIAGGNDATLTPVNTAELFDPALGTFTSLNPYVMTSARRFHSGTLLPNGSVLLTGGDIEHVSINTAELFTFVTCLPIPPLTSVVSRKVHGSAGTFDINLPLTGTRGVECRSPGQTGTAGVDYQVVFTFANNITTCGTAGTTGGSVVSGPNANQCTENLTGIANGQYTTVTLNGVTDVAGNSGNVTGPQIGLLVGDVNASGVVTSGDTNLCKAQALQTVTNSNFRNDINASGAITTGDVNIIKQNALSQLPQPP